MKMNNYTYAVGRLSIEGPSGLAAWGGCISEQLLFLDESKMGKISWQTTFPHFQHWCDLCPFCTPSNSLMPLVHVFLKFAPAALGWTIAGSALAPQLGAGKTKTRKQAGAAGDMRRMGQHQLVPSLTRDQEVNGEWGAGITAPHVSQQENALSCPTDGPCSWNNVIKCNTPYGTDCSSLGEPEVKKANASWLRSRCFHSSTGLEVSLES
jgi:hypothetical protein